MIRRQGSKETGSVASTYPTYNGVRGSGEPQEMFPLKKRRKMGVTLVATLKATDLKNYCDLAKHSCHFT